MNAPLLLILSLFLQLSLIGQVIPSYSVTAHDSTSKGYYFTCPIKVGANASSFLPMHLILDDKGEVAYYKFFPAGQSTGDFKIQPNGLISYSNKGKYYLMDSTFSVVDSVVQQNGLQFDGHDLQVLPNGNFLLLASETVQMKLTSYNYFNGNGSPGAFSANVKCGVIQELDPNKNVVFEWHTKDYYNFSDVDSTFLFSPTNVDWTHLNAVEYDTDGNILLSVRHFNEITKINRADSTIIWRLGGKQNQFNFLNDVQKFHGQHDIRRVANGNITLFDNGGSLAHAAAAKEYQLNETGFTASLVWGHSESINAYSGAMGNHQVLPNGSRLIDYGTINNSKVAFNVIRPNSLKAFEIIFADTLLSYRSFNYQTFPWKLNRPIISCDAQGGQVVLSAENGHASYKWSNGATTQTILVTNTGTYNVTVPKGQGGFIISETFTVSNFSTPCLVSGIGEKEKKNNILVYPNPATDAINIDAPPGSSPALDVELFDALGTLIHKYRYNVSSRVTIPIQNLPKGIYFLKVNQFAKKVVVE